MKLSMSLMQISEQGISEVFEDNFWNRTKPEQCVLLVLYAAHICEKEGLSYETIRYIINKKKLLKKTVEEFKKILTELKDNRETCQKFLDSEFT